MISMVNMDRVRFHSEELDGMIMGLCSNYGGSTVFWKTRWYHFWMPNWVFACYVVLILVSGILFFWKLRDGGFLHTTVQSAK